jgi:hypothetical protein
MRAWRTDRSISAGALRHLLVAEQWQVHAKGVRLQGVLISGQLDLESATLRCPLRLDRCYLDNDGPVVLDYAAASVLILTGCHVAGLRADTLVVTRELDLRGTTFTGPVRLLGAGITSQLSMRGAQLTGADQDGTALAADGLKIGGNVLLETFTAAGAVRLVEADIAGQLSMHGAQLTGADRDGNALTADRLKIDGAVFLDSSPDQGTFTAMGTVSLPGAQVGGSLYLTGADLKAEAGKTALNAEGIKAAEVFLDGRFNASGAIRLPRADITGQLNCRGALLTGCDKNGNALYGERMKVGGDVFLDSGPDQGTFTAKGAVCLLSADITGQLNCRGALLTGRDKYGNAPHGDGMKVGGDMVLDKAFSASETISLASARMDTLRWAPARQISKSVILRGATVGELTDDWSGERANGHWPGCGLLSLEGFTYGRFGGDQRASVDQRLKWIRSQYRRSPTDWLGFATQPFEQLAAVYRQAGQGAQARKVAIARRADLRKFGNLNPYRWFGNLFLDKTIKYGYRTWRAAVGLTALFVVFLVLSIAGQHQHVIVPIRDVTRLQPVPSATQCTSNYPCFYPAGYTVDKVIPIINVHQADYWGPDGHAPWGWFWVGQTRVATGAGWALATLLVAGYTGLVRRD